MSCSPLHHDLLDFSNPDSDVFRRVSSAPSNLSLLDEDSEDEQIGMDYLEEIEEVEDEDDSDDDDDREDRRGGASSTDNKYKTIKKRRRIVSASLVAVVFFGCAAVVPTELAVRRDRDAMQLITIFNYVLVTAEAWLDLGYETLIAERQIPMRNHVVTLSLGLLYNLAQNGAITIGLPMAMVLILKNSQLIFQMVANATFVGERYLLIHELAAGILVAGILVVVASTTTGFMDSFLAFFKQKDDEAASEAFHEDRRVMFVGVLLMIVANVSRATSNVVTQRAFAVYGTHYIEKLFYEHALGLPFLLLPNPLKLLRQAWAWTKQRESVVFAVAGRQFFSARLPMLWILVSVQTYATFECTRASARVLGLSSAVTLALALAMQRFASIVFSAAVLNAPP